MIIDSANLDSQLSIDTEICVLGGGVAGIVLANELSKQFAHTVVIEAGAENYSAEVQAFYEPAENSQHFPDPSYSRMRFLGGSSNHWQNNTSQLDPIDFEKRSWVADSGWPISFADVSPYYERAAEYCGTGTDGYFTASWTNRLQHPDVVKKSAVLTSRMAKAAVPPTRFFHAHGEALVQSGSVAVYTHAYVVDARFNVDTERVEEVYFRSPNGLQHRVRAKAFIMCFGGIENARMLLQLNRKYNDQLGNQFDNVGRYFMDHPVVRAAHLYPFERSQYGLYEAQIVDGRLVLGFLQLTEAALRKHQVNNLRMPLTPASQYIMSDGISSYHILKDALGDLDIPDDFGRHLANAVGDIDMVIEAISRKAFDKSLFGDADEFGGFQIPMMMEQTPSRSNRIRLTDKLDQYGVPKIAVDWELKTADKDLLWRTLEVVAQEIGAMSIGRVRLLRERSSRIFEDQMGFGHHHMGTTRMATGPDKGVVDRNQMVFGTQNFFMGGSSVFTTGGHVPPTLTIAALSIRLARHIAQRFAGD